MIFLQFQYSPSLLFQMSKPSTKPSEANSDGNGEFTNFASDWTNYDIGEVAMSDTVMSPALHSPSQVLNYFISSLCLFILIWNKLTN
jgi:hypothetical protein